MTLQQMPVAHLKVEGMRRAVDGAKPEKRSKPGQQQAPATVKGSSLLDLALIELPILCRPWIPPGILVAAGRPKIGKTSRSRQKAVHVSTGKDLWGAPCKRAKVLFLSLEEGNRLMARKLKGASYRAADLQDIDFAFDWPRGLEGAQALREYLDANPDVLYVVVDSLTRFRDVPTRDKPQFVQDYEAVQFLADVVKDRPGLALEIIHHTTKAVNGSDPIADISGTFGISAAADSYEVLRKEGSDYVVHCGGRYWDEPNDAFAMVRDSGRWNLGGTHDGIILTTMQREYLRVVVDCRTVTSKGIAQRLGRAESSVSEIVRELAVKGLIFRSADGWQPTEIGSKKVSE